MVSIDLRYPLRTEGLDVSIFNEEDTPPIRITLEWIICPKCKGMKRYDVLDTHAINSQTITPPYKSVECDLCNGEGEIENKNKG